VVVLLADKVQLRTRHIALQYIGALLQFRLAAYNGKIDIGRLAQTKGYKILEARVMPRRL
jgi:hypothetical protein